MKTLQQDKNQLRILPYAEHSHATIPIRQTTQTLTHVHGTSFHLGRLLPEVAVHKAFKPLQYAMHPVYIHYPSTKT
jgi:hypothetical protein